MGKRKTNAEFLEILRAKRGDEFIPLEKYVGMHHKITFRHRICDREFDMKPISLVRSMYGCPLCSQRKRKSTNEFDLEVKSLDSNYVLKSEYLNNKTPVELLHIECGRLFSVRPNDFISGNRCPMCSGVAKKTTDEFKREVENLDENYKVLGEYVNNKEHIEILHTECGGKFYMAPNRFLSGNRCPNCIPISLGEDAIKTFLEDNHISYTHDEKHPDMDRPLRFDFFIEDFSLVIEFDGEQHFKPSFGRGEEYLEVIRERDRFKDDWCLENDLDILRIPYTEIDNIDNILRETFNDYSVEEVEVK